MSRDCLLASDLVKAKIVGDEFLTAIDFEEEFHVNLLFDRSINAPMCTHMGKNYFVFVID